MAKGTRALQLTRYAAVMLLAVLLMSACNLGQQTPTDPNTAVTPVEGQNLNGEQPIVQEEQPVVQDGVTATPLINLPPTDTPVPELLPAEQLGPVVIDGTEHRALEESTIRLRRGNNVSGVTCSWTLQDTGQSSSLGSPVSSTPADPNTAEDVYSFTPDAAGTYVVNCNGTATTVSGNRTVNTSSNPFTVQAKG